MVAPVHFRDSAGQLVADFHTIAWMGPGVLSLYGDDSVANANLWRGDNAGMSMGEFDLIATYFMRPAGVGPRRAAIGNGDDCAVLAPAIGMQLAVSTDTMVEGRHFLSTVSPVRLGHKALAVNLSDLAACGARPLGFTLGLTLPRVDTAWLAGFSQGLLALADQHDCELVGGDTTAGPLAIGITVFGEVPAGGALLRSGARPDDDLWVSGYPGMARLGLEAFRGNLEPSLSAQAFDATRQAMECPQPRIGLGLALRGLATAAIDVSDGLLGDLGHILQCSDVLADVFVDTLPVSPCLAARSRSEQLNCILAGGDDYELVFTTPPARRREIAALGRTLGLPLTRIGRIGGGGDATVAATPRLRLWKTGLDAPAAQRGAPVSGGWASFDHFREAP
jgi:thiamine-monophosphate kinase